MPVGRGERHCGQKGAAGMPAQPLTLGQRQSPDASCLDFEAVTRAGCPRDAPWLNFRRKTDHHAALIHEQHIDGQSHGHRMDVVTWCQKQAFVGAQTHAPVQTPQSADKGGRVDHAGEQRHRVAIHDEAVA